jgi:hypothetical protein
MGRGLYQSYSTLKVEMPQSVTRADFYRVVDFLTGTSEKSSSKWKRPFHFKTKARKSSTVAVSETDAFGSGAVTGAGRGRNPNERGNWMDVSSAGTTPEAPDTTPLTLKREAGPATTFARQDEQMIGTISLFPSLKKDEIVKRFEKWKREGNEKDWHISDKFPEMTVLYKHEGGSDIE